MIKSHNMQIQQINAKRVLDETQLNREGDTLKEI